MRLRTRGTGVADNDYITIHTIVDQTPNPKQVYEDLRKNMIPADIVLDYSTILGEDWLDVKTTKATWNAVKTGFTDWHQAYTTLSGDTVFTRPAP
jgi:hypothetical protein